MNALEQRLRNELRSESELIRQDSLLPLDLVGQDNLAKRRSNRQPRHVWLAPIAAAVSVALIAALVGIVSHQVAVTGPNPNGAGTPTAGQLQGIYAVSARDAWAVGYLDVGQTKWSNMTDEALTVHWDGHAWKRVAVPTVPGDSRLNSIAGTSADNIWAVGVWGNGLHPIEPLILHWNGQKWRIEQFAYATKAGALDGVAATSATDAWATGQTGGSNPGSLILHWNGSTWKQVPAPQSASNQNLLSVTATSADNAWAVGDSSRGAQILHWNGSSWTQQRGPNLRGTPVVLGSVTTDSAGHVWAVGFTGYQPSSRLIMRWDGTAWHLVPGPTAAADATLWSVTAVSSSNVWAAGASSTRDDTVILHWDGTAWTAVTAPGSTFHGFMYGLAAISPDDIWAVGYRGIDGAYVPQIIHWNGTSWKRVYGPASTRGLLQNSSCGPYQGCGSARGHHRVPHSGH